MIRYLSSYNIGQSVRDDGPESHFSKAGTPTMGGALILVAIVVSTLLWSDLSSRFVWVVLFVTIGFGAIGWIDDYKKIVHKNSKGLAARHKYLWQSIFGLTAALILYHTAKFPIETQLIVPFFKDFFTRFGLDVCRFNLFCHCWQQQCGQFDRWFRWTGDSANCSGWWCTRSFCLLNG